MGIFGPSNFKIKTLWATLICIDKFDTFQKKFYLSRSHGEIIYNNVLCNSSIQVNELRVLKNEMTP